MVFAAHLTSASIFLCEESANYVPQEGCSNVLFCSVSNEMIRSLYTFKNVAKAILVDTNFNRILQF